MKIILSTRNPSKAVQIRAIFEGSLFRHRIGGSASGTTILTLDDAGIRGEAVEDGTTLKENALKKALFAHERAKTKSWTMADDTGFFIDALDGEPGVRAARWAGENVETKQITEHTLKSIKGVADRSATFETVVALVSPEGKQYFFNGKVRGKILGAPRVPPQPKMPYSPIFMPDGQNKVWAEMTTEEENAISHRGKAFRKAREFLENYLK